MNIGLIAVDSVYPNLALMKPSSRHGTKLIRNSDGVYETASIEEVEEHDIFRENEV